MGVTNWNGLPSTILPVGKWSFPVGISSRDDGKIGNPVISARHVGRGKMLGYGHESWITGGHTNQELMFSLQAVQWVCGKEAEIGISYGSGLSHYKDDLEILQIHQDELQLINFQQKKLLQKLKI